MDGNIDYLEYGIWVFNNVRNISQMTITTVSPYIKNAIKSNPDLSSLLLLLVILYLSLLILSRATKMIYSMVLSTVKLIIFSIIIVTILWVSTRGASGVYEDAYKIFKEFDSTTVQSNFQSYAQKSLFRLAGF